MTIRQHPIVKLNGNEYIKFDLSNWGFPGVFAIGTEDDVFHQTGYAAIQNGEVWRKGQVLMLESELEDTGRTWTEPEDLLDIWADHGLPTKVHGAEPDRAKPDTLDDIEVMTIDELLAKLQELEAAYQAAERAK